MSERTLWILPVSSTAFEEGGSVLEDRPGREIAVRFSFERDDDLVRTRVVFEGVEAFRVTYLSALDQAMRVAYDKLIDRGATDWLRSIETEMTRLGHECDDIKHLMILFDDGPCYEVICKSFRVEESP